MFFCFCFLLLLSGAFMTILYCLASVLLSQHSDSVPTSYGVLREQLFGIKLNLVWAELHLRRFITDVFVHSINGEWRGPARFEAISTVLSTRGLHKMPKKVISHLHKFYNKLKNEIRGGKNNWYSDSDKEFMFQNKIFYSLFVVSLHARVSCCQPSDYVTLHGLFKRFALLLGT